MTKLFLVIYLFGHVGGSAGPLDMVRCVALRDEMRAAQADGLREGVNVTTGAMLTAEERRRIAGLTFACEWRENRPALSGSSIQEGGA